MTIEDFSNGFDTLCNSYIRNNPYGLTMSDIRFDEYEKSLFLTKAQQDFAVNLYNGNAGAGFEVVEENRRYLTPLVSEHTFTNADSKGSFGGNVYTLPSKLWFITHESVTVSDASCENMSVQDVIPVRQDEYNRLKRNPFRGVSVRRALRLDIGNNKVEILSSNTISKYFIMYLRKPAPIILVNLEDDVKIEGESAAQTSELHEALHGRILELAVRMALQSKTIGNVSNNNNNNSNAAN